jgi:DNA-binding transcriptional LysR family regulator
MPELNLTQLRTFIAAAENQSFIGAADSVHRSQAAVSMQIMKLEKALGQTLFERHTRKIALTPAGETLLPFARRLLTLNADAISALQTQQITGRVVLGAPDDFVASLLPSVLEHFSKTFANVEIELVCMPGAQLRPLLNKGLIDLAFVSRNDGLDGIFVRREPLVWVGAERHTAWEKDPLPVALYEKGCITRDYALQALEKSKRHYCATYSSASMVGLLAMVESGLAIAALAECSAPKHLRRLGKTEGLKSMKPIDIVLIKGRNKSSGAIEQLAREIMESLGTP